MTAPLEKQLLTFLSIWWAYCSTLRYGEFGIPLELGPPPECKFLLKSTMPSSYNTEKKRKNLSLVKSSP